MEQDAFQFLADSERDHWWFRGRREFIRASMERIAPPRGARILDAGCGSGGNLALLAEFGAIHGFEYDDRACAHAAALGIGPVATGSLPDHVPFADTRFDVIGLFDVLEHLEHPVESLVRLRERLTGNGAVLLTVPACPWLWGPYDEACHHFRRYTAETLTEHLQAAGFRIDYLSHFNALLLPLAIVQRLKERAFGYSSTELSTSPGLSKLLFRIFRLERRWVPASRLPFGLSLIAIARRA